MSLNWLRSAGVALIGLIDTFRDSFTHRFTHQYLDLPITKGSRGSRWTPPTNKYALVSGTACPKRAGVPARTQHDAQHDKGVFGIHRAFCALVLNTTTNQRRLLCLLPM